MFRINRPSLISEVWTTSQNGSVLITGSPGVGKSWLVGQFTKICKSNRRYYLGLIAEDYPVKSLEELKLALGLKTDVLSFLGSLSGNPVLIIDGLDSLRSDPSQRTFRELIRRLSRHAPRCSVVASIRTFDLRQSQEFQKLFFATSASLGGKTFTELAVPPLSDEDLLDVTLQMPGIEPLLKKTTAEIKQLLRNPFNLRLAAELVEGGSTASELAGFDSQVQLLNRYWSWRIETPSDRHERKVFLRTVSKVMVERKSLSVSEGEIATIGLGNAISGLQSDEVIRQSPTGRITFTHNILFDYGVARLLLDETTVEQFIVDDPSRTIFFRPSLAYFFHHLWLADRNLFWKVSNSFFESQTLPERARIIPAVSIYEAARKVEDLNPILSVSNDAEIRAITGALRAVQSLGGLQSTRRPLWIEVLGQLSLHLKLAFINEYTALINIADETKTTDEAGAVFACAALLLLWIWDISRELDRDRAISLADFGAGRVLPLILKSYRARPEIARQITMRVLDRYGLPFAGANEAFRLAREIKTIIQNDPAVAVEVYRRTFGYKEASQETTRIGGGAALSMTSTRAQDFSMSLYGLQMAFPTFLHTAPEDAAIAAIDAVNAEIERERPMEMDSQSKSLAQFVFEYEGSKAAYRADFSEIWDSGTRQYESLSLMNSVLSYVSQDLSKPENSELSTRVVNAIAHRASFAVTWKRVLQAASAHIRVMYPHVRSLLKVPEFISAPETTIAVGEVLKSAYGADLVPSIDGLEIEKAILGIPVTRVILRYENADSIRNRLLMCIPREKIQSNEAARLADDLQKAAAVRENKPYHSTSFFQKSYGTEDWLKDQGVEITKEANAKILEALEPLQEFERKYLNEVPSTDACLLLESSLEHMERLLTVPDVDEKAAETARGVLSAAAKAVLKNGELSIESSVFRTCRAITLQGSRDASPRFDAEHGSSFDMPSWGGSQPRIESTQGLALILWNWGPDGEVVERLRQLSHDLVPAVRFQVAQGLLGFWKHKATTEFWELLEDMIVRERTAGVMMALVGQVGQIAGQEPKRVAKLLSAIFDRGVPTTKRSDLTESLVRVLVGLYVVRNDDQANKQLLQFEADPIGFNQEVSQEVYVASYYLVPDGAKERETRVRASELFLRILAGVYRSLERLSQDQTRTDKSEDFGKLLKVLDHVAIRIFHTLDVNPYRESGELALDDASKRAIYMELKPILRGLTVGRSLTGKLYLAPHTAHYLMQTLNSVLSFDPEAVVEYAAAVCRAGGVMGYQFDPDSIGEMVKLVEHVLADHREILREPSVANSLGEMLDMFVSAGWPEAMSLTFRLDQAIR